MNIENLFKLIVMELSSDSIKLECELERVINSNNDTESKLKEIKELLVKITNAEASMAKFSAMINNDKNNNNLKKEKNGTI